MRRTAPVRIQRSCFAPNGGAIGIQRTGFDGGPEGNGPSPGVDEHVDLVPERREPFGHRRDVHRSARRAGHGLVDGAVENLHGSMLNAEC